MYKGRKPKLKTPRVEFHNGKQQPAATIISTHRVQTDVAPGYYNQSVERGSTELGPNLKVRTLDPNWKVKVAKKQDATNPYTLRVHEGRSMRLSGISFYKQFNVESSGFTVNVPGITLTEWSDTSTQELALKRLKAKISDNVGFYNAAVPIAELKELRQSAVSLVESTADVFNKIHARLVQRRIVGKSYRRALADAWLQWSFGIKPLLGTLSDANEAISKFLTGTDHVVKLTGSAFLQRNAGSRSPGSTGLYGAPYTGYAQGFDQLFYKYTGSFDLKVNSSNDYSASNVFGLNPSSILPTLYELTPYSWMLDYFTSVGDYLNDTFTVAPGSTIYLSLTRTCISAQTLTAAYNPIVGVFMKYEHVDPGHRRMKFVQRTKLTSLPHIGLRIKTLGEIEKNAASKVANLLSVLKLAHGGQYGTGGKGVVRDPVSNRRRAL